MYRYVIFEKDGNLIKKGKSKTIKVGRHLLELETTYFFNGYPFFVMKGHGDIDLKYLPNSKPSFNKVNIENLDYFIQYAEHKATDYEEQEQIENFCRIYKINSAHYCPKLYTQEYNDLERSLYDYKNVVVIERF